jgi:hypothetical protein
MLPLFVTLNSFTHTLLHPHPEKIAIYEKMCKNIVEPGRPQMSIWHMRIACRKTKATNTYSDYEIFIVFSTATMVTRTLPVFLNVFCITYILWRIVRGQYKILIPVSYFDQYL